MFKNLIRRQTNLAKLVAPVLYLGTLAGAGLLVWGATQQNNLDIARTHGEYWVARKTGAHVCLVSIQGGSASTGNTQPESSHKRAAPRVICSRRRPVPRRAVSSSADRSWADV